MNKSERDVAIEVMEDEKPVLTIEQLLDLAFDSGRRYGAKECMESGDYRKLYLELRQKLNHELERTLAMLKTFDHGFRCI